MKKEEIIAQLKERFATDIIEVFDKSEKRVYVTIQPAALVRIATHVFREVGARFNIASGSDARDHFEILYHFTVEEINLLISLRVRLPKTHPVIDSLTGLMKGADWIEREMRELLGIEFTGHPDPRRLLLSDEWPEGVYPLRCDYKEWDEKAIRDRGLD